MRDFERAKIVNKNKHLLKIGDIAISEKYGVGIIDRVEMNDDVLNPIHVQFPQYNYITHQYINGYDCWYDCAGEGYSQDNIVVFYSKLNLME